MVGFFMRVCPYKPLDPRFHPLGQPGVHGPASLPPYLRWMYKIPKPFRLPTILGCSLLLQYKVATWIFQWPPRDENGVRIPTYHDKQFFHDQNYLYMKELYEPYAKKEIYRLISNEYLEAKGIKKSE